VPATLRHRIRDTIDAEAIKEIHAVLDEVESLPECRVLVLEGGGDGVFCTGLNLEKAAVDTLDDGGAAFFGLLRRFTTTPRAVVARVDGRVAGGGVGLAAASDFVYATERSAFSLPEALWGLLPCCVLPFLIRRTGFQEAYAMTFSTQPVDAPQALRFHLVDEVVADAEPAIRRLAYRLTKLDTSIIADMKRYFQTMWNLSNGMDEMERTAVAEFGRLMSSPDVRRRLTDYAAEKRFPWERA
jgi:polyketide biosynthesis enoyl-CoA hydratase PksH